MLIRRLIWPRVDKAIAKASNCEAWWEKDGVSVWLLILAIFVPISVAMQNVVAIGGGLFILARGFFSKRLQFTILDGLFLAGVASLYLIEWMHDGSPSHLGGLALLFYFLVKVGENIRGQLPEWAIIVTIGLAVGMLVGFFIDVYRRPEYDLWATSGIKYANEAAFAAVVGFFFAFECAKKAIAFVAMSFFLLFVVMAGARASMLGLLGGVGLIFSLKKNVRAVLALLVTIGIAGGILLLGKLPDPIHSRVALEIDQPRLDLWRHGWQLAVEDRFLGRGEEQFSSYQVETMRKRLSTEGGYWASLFKRASHHRSLNISFHNEIVQVLVEYGAVGAGLVMSLLFFPLLILFKRAKKKVLRSTHVVGIGLWSAFIVHNMFELGFYNSSCILMGLAVGLFDLFGRSEAVG